MMNRKELLIIIPAYNEEQNIRDVLLRIEQMELFSTADVLIIDDASTDSTGWIVKEMQYPVISHPYNMGYGCALQTGYKYASRCGYRYVIQMDADGQHDVCNIPALYAKLKEADGDGRYPDIVLGARFREGSSDFPVSLPKRIAYSVFRKLIRLTTGEKFSDTTTGLQGLSRRAFLYYSQCSHFDDKYPDANMLILMLLLKFKVVEIPAVMHARTVGKSIHSGLKPIWYMFRAFYSIAANLFRVKLLRMDAEVGLRSADGI